MENAFAEKTKGAPPYYLVKKVLEYLPECKSLRALDLGASSLRHSIFLAQQGIHVFAIDKIDGIRKYHSEAGDVKDLIDAKQKGICEFLNENRESFDVILAIHVLPFLPAECCEAFFQKLPNFLIKNGVLAMTFWGPKDDFARKGVATMSKDSIMEKLSAFGVLFAKENESDGPTATGWQKHWHVIDILARKL